MERMKGDAIACASSTSRCGWPTFTRKRTGGGRSSTSMSRCRLISIPVNPISAPSH